MFVCTIYVYIQLTRDNDDHTTALSPCFMKQVLLSVAKPKLISVYGFQKKMECWIGATNFQGHFLVLNRPTCIVKSVQMVQSSSSATNIMFFKLSSALADAIERWDLLESHYAPLKMAVVTKLVMVVSDEYHVTAMLIERIGRGC